MQTNRCGPKSVWHDLTANNSSIQVKTFPTLPKNAPKVDVVVIGGGITGLCTALQLSQAGKSVAVLEAIDMGCGVTGYSTAKVTSQHNLIYDDLTSKFGEATARSYGQMNEFGLQYVADVVEKYKIDCNFSRRSAIIYTTDEKSVETLQKETEAAKKAGLPASFVTEIPELPFKIHGAMVFTNQAQFNSHAFCKGLANVLSEQPNVVLYEQSRVTTVNNLKAPHSIETANGSIECDFIVHATHVPIMDRSGHFGVMQPICSYVVAFKAAEASTATVKFPVGMYMSMDEPSRSIRSAGGDDSILVIGGNGHTVGEYPDGNAMNAVNDLEHWTHSQYGNIEKLAHWMAHDYRSPDHLPYIGYLHRGCDSMFTATGFQKWGLSAGAASGKIITDLITGECKSGNPSFDWHEKVDARRWDIIHAGPNIIKTQIEVGKHFIGDRIKHAMENRDIEDLAAGEGAICKNKNGEKVAAYRDAATGQLLEMSPLCTHLGCHILWNQGDKTWDCPCHGSRFNYDGQVIHGPAVLPLKPKSDATAESQAAKI